MRTLLFSPKRIVPYAIALAAMGCSGASKAQPASSTATLFSPPPDLLSRDAVLDQARHDALSSNTRAQARASFTLLLAHNPNDDEARAGLARLDAWDGRWKEAEKAYRGILSRHPEDEEVRVGLIDVLLWQHRWEQASDEIDNGLARAPDTSALWERRARLQHWFGDEALARASLERAFYIASDESSIRSLGDRIFLGEARLVGRQDFYPSGYANLSAAEGFVKQAWKRFLFTVHTEQSERPAATASGKAYNAAYLIGVSHTISPVLAAGVEGGLGAPAPSIPKWIAGFFMDVSVAANVSFGAAYSWREFSNDSVLHIVHPGLQFTVTDTLRVGANYWFSYLVSPVPGSGLTPLHKGVHSVGFGGAWRAAPRIEIGADYVYGVQLDLQPTLSQLAELRSHFVSVSVDWRLARELGLHPLYRLERRSTSYTNLWIHTMELGLYTRW